MVTETRTSAILFDAIRHRVAIQDEAAVRIEHKALAAGLLIALVTGLAALLLGRWPSVAFGVIGMGGLILATRVLWPADYQVVPEPQPLFDTYWDRDEDEVHGTMVATMAGAFDHNRAIVNAKARQLSWALVALAVEATLLMVAVVVEAGLALRGG